MPQNNRRSPEEWHALSQFLTTLGFVMCVIGVVFGVLYCVMFVTQPMKNQAPNDAFLMELLKTVLISMISIIGTLVAVGHGSQASTTPVTPPKPPVPPVPQVPVKPLSNPASSVPSNNTSVVP